MTRRGFLLPAVLLLICLIVLLAVTRHFFSREHLNMAAHLADYERAYHVANGALLAARDMWLRLEEDFNRGGSSPAGKSQDAPDELRKVYAKLLDSEGFPITKGVRFSWEDPLLADLVEGWKDATVPKVEIELRPGESLFSNPAGPGFRTDSRETQFHLFVRASAGVGDATCNLSWYKPMKIINILPPVIGKFALFIRGQGSLALNRLEDSSSFQDLKDSPLVVGSDTGIPGSTYAPDSFSDHIDRQGWVFLGGAPRWTLGLAAGGGDVRFSDALVPGGCYTYPMAPEEPLAAEKFKFSYYVSPRPLQRGLRAPECHHAFARCSSRDPDCSSILHLNGNGKAPSPTLVLGNVGRRWALVQGLKNDDKGVAVAFPMLDTVTFQGNSWPGGESSRTIGKIRDNFGGSFELYEKRMSNLITEPYNAGLYRMIEFPGDPFEKIVVIDSEKFPAGFKPPPPPKRVKIDGQPARLGEMACGSSYTLLDDSGRELFVGGDLSLIEDLSFLEKRVGARFENLEKMLGGLPKDKAGYPTLPGVILLEKGMNVTEPVHFGNGGMVLVKGSVRLQSQVSVEGNDGPLTIISLVGEIRVETPVEIEAGLIALQGTVFIPAQARIHGLLAARELSLAVSDPPRPRQIVYDHAFDPTDSANWKRGFRFQTGGEEVFLVR